MHVQGGYDNMCLLVSLQDPSPYQQCPFYGNITGLSKYSDCSVKDSSPPNGVVTRQSTYGPSPSVAWRLQGSKFLQTHHLACRYLSLLGMEIFGVHKADLGLRCLHHLHETSHTSASRTNRSLSVWLVCSLPLSRRSAANHF